VLFKYSFPWVYTHPPLGRYPPGVLLTGQGFALVELYTLGRLLQLSLPPDELVAPYPKSYSSGFYLLSFHVDYWDRLAERSF